MNSINYLQLATNEINSKTKPLGALGQLEKICIQLASIQKTLKPEIYPARVLVFGADHGVSQQGVSAFPAHVTTQMMANFACGGAAINVIANSVNASIKVIDIGVNSDLSALENVSHNKVTYGTNDLSQSCAMSLEDCDKALAVGAEHALDAKREGVKTIALGEMGIGNTTSAAALICAFTKHSALEIVGRGTGIDDDALNRKYQIVNKALLLHQNSLNCPKQTLVALGGLEIAGIVGAILKAHELEMVIIVDGYISTAAALTAYQINPQVLSNCIFSHQSAERGHKLALKHLNVEPVLRLGLRLGEGTGAALSIPDMATFEQAGVSEKATK